MNYSTLNGIYMLREYVCHIKEHSARYIAGVQTCPISSDIEDVCTQAIRTETI